MLSWRAVVRALCIGLVGGALSGLWVTLGSAVPRSDGQPDLAALPSRMVNDQPACDAGATCGDRYPSPPLIEPTALSGRE